jgi:predicted anti-sigma-YlaC factor YlaD
MALHAGPAIRCEEVVELVTTYLEGTMRRLERRRFELHLRACDGCTTYLEQMRETIEATGRLTPEQISAEARDAFMHVFRDWKTAQQQ